MITVAERRVKISRDIAASEELVWDCITDISKWPQWGPSVSAVDCEHQFIKQNSSGRVKTILGFWLPFEVISFEKSVYWKWRVGGIEATGHGLEKLGEESTRLTFDMPLWAMFYILICYLALRNIDRISSSKYKK